MNPKNNEEKKIIVKVDTDGIAWAGFWIGAGIIVGAEMISKVL